MKVILSVKVEQCQEEWPFYLCGHAGGGKQERTESKGKSAELRLGTAQIPYQLLKLG